MNEMSKILPEAATEVVRPKRRPWLLMLSVPLLIVVIAAYFWLTSGRTVTTDNAEIGAPVVTISAEVSGKIVEVDVHENQHVKPGDVLFKLDPAPYQIALLEAQAALGNAKMSVSELKGTAASKDADASNKAAAIQSTAAQVALARETFRRQSDLMAKGFTTRAQLDAARSGLVSAQAAHVAAVADTESARASATAARAKLGVDVNGVPPTVASAQAMVEKAQLDLSRTIIRAPIAGTVTQSDKLQIGNNVLQALPEVSVVGNGNYWVDANFKETQLAQLRIGQTADVEIDAIPGKTFCARVSGIGAGTGSQFSLLPAQNATGNWVKVTQRVPVRLVLCDAPRQPLAAGWSATVTVHVAH
jgi:membrane fusion protein (multidrug efflux system)